MPGDPVPSTGFPVGVRVLPLKMNSDRRGGFTEIFREEWPTGVRPVQWNLVSSEAGVLRGVHVHLQHDDYLVVAQGRAAIGLRDLREGSPTEGVATAWEASGDDLAAIVIPAGVAHGFWFHTRALHVYAVTRAWDPEDELACRWDDPDLAIPWPRGSPQLSERDAAAPPLRDLLRRLKPRQPIAAGKPG